VTRVFAGLLGSWAFGCQWVFPLHHDESPADAGAAPVDAQLGDAPSPSDPCDGGSHLFCDDFDRPNPVLVPPWDGVDVHDGGAASIVVGGTYRSPPDVADVVAAPGGTVRVTKGIPFSSSSIRCSVDVYVEQRATREADLFEVTLDSQNGGFYLARLKLEGAVSATDSLIDFGQLPDAGKVATTTTPAPRVANGAWTTISIAVGFGANGRLVVTIGDQKVVRDVPALQEMTPGAGADLWIGLIAAPGDTGAWHVLYDNMVCDLE
jgi:hypothetical protein